MTDQPPAPAPEPALAVLPDLEPTAVLVIEDAEPADDDGPENDDRVELVRTGLIRLWVNGQRFRLRRPFFGELKELRLALAALTDEIQDSAIRAQAISAQLHEDATALATNAEISPEARADELVRIRTRDREASREMTGRADELRVEWWGRVFATLSLDGPLPEGQEPAWLLDPFLPGKVTQHWRAVPLARGG